MDFDKVIKTRTSLKKYSNKKVPMDKVMSAIEAAVLAPSPGNLSILKFLIIEDEDKKEKIAQACQQEFVSTAPVIIIVCSEPKKIEIMYDKRKDRYIKHHVGAVVENFLLKITDMNLASCWVGAFSTPTIKTALKIPDDVNVEVVLPIAYPSKIDKTKQKPKPELDKVIYFETWKNNYKKEVRKIGGH